jgi:energy-coupling factor transporter ATP-binding protein EcfA2
VLLLLEGPDGAGKTTLAKTLCDALAAREDGDVTYLHKGPPVAHPLEEYETPLYSYRPNQHQHVVCDRWHLGEVIYPRLLNRATQLDEPTLWHLELFLASRGALMIHVTAPLQVLRDRLANDGDWLVDQDHLAPMRSAYFAAFGETTLPTELLNAGTVTPQAVQRLLIRARELEQHSVGLEKFITYVGPRYPDRLLLGDTRNFRSVPDHAHVELTPAFVPYPATSGHFLLETLLTRAPRRSFAGRIGIANACDVDDPILLWTTLRRPRIVLLGGAAKTRVGLNGSAWPTRHPQYVRRFHHRRQVEYAADILDETRPTWNE